MRLSFPFALLGLLHVARGGELDSFASDRARHLRQGLASRDTTTLDPSNISSTSPVPDLPSAFQRREERRQRHDHILRKLDTNSDEHVDHDEVLKALAFHWKGEENARRMLRAFGSPDIEDLMRHHSRVDNTRVAKEDLADLLDAQPLEAPDYCPAIRAKVEGCPTQAVLKCSAYLTATEAFCRAGVENMVEKCIMSESCDNVCTCIAAVEDAAHGNGALVHQGQVVSFHQLDVVDHPQNELQSRQGTLALIFVGLFIAAIIEYFVISVAWLVNNIEKSLTSANPWMDTVGWDGKPPEPACSSYVFWGHCGAILSSKARNCPDGGQRVFGNSCKDHFRYGSQGCGFLGLGCQSLCSKVNTKGCGCSLFDWSEFDGQDMPGFDIRSFFTTKVSECRSACASDKTCEAFVLSPFSGDQDAKKPNCYLKNAQRLTQPLEGSTVFFKRGINKDCGAPANFTDSVPFDYDWWTAPASKRSDSESESSELSPRAGSGKGELPFPFNREAAEYYLAWRFLQLVYQRLASEFTYRYYTVTQRQIGDTTRTSTTGGGRSGRPADTPYIENENMPQWRPTEIGNRITGIFRTLLQHALNGADDPVASFLNQNVPATAAQRAQFPDSVRQLLAANSAVVHASTRSDGETWLGYNRVLPQGANIAAYPGVRGGADNAITFWQRGNVGPFSLEAAFIYATQAAGINFRALGRTYQYTSPGWWFNVMGRGFSENTCLQERDSQERPLRTFGYIYAENGGTQHDTRAGVYMAFDLDPTETRDDRHNIFVFVVHALDANSVIGATDTQLRNVNVGTSARWFNARPNESAPYNNGGTQSDTGPGAAGAGSNSRLVAHAHAATITRAQLQDWLNGGRGAQGFPAYTQFGTQHIYILTEDFDMGTGNDADNFPRKSFFPKKKG